ncbi:hypothetical protein FBZ84_101169 [Azospirillum baldaniorum]|uniref:DUF2280 domain-containing protein n=1 Tax=Azospirillum baldaniorum TaxID=1064539 RepID=UPI00119E5225|nr:DUF2280 domain-containing protein [Azospirillum baldaniorum]TWA71903.1 hypothetical protein FBZ84_101169 [Azospirillum baldaniorum]
MAALNDDAKLFIVQALACFDTPSQVVEAVKQEFGEVIPRQQVELYDPTKRAGRKLAEKWKAIFKETRETFLEDTSAIGISHKAVRLRALNRMAAKAETMGNMALAAQLMEQAAKECGDAFTNKVRNEHTGKDGGPILKAEIPADPVEASKAYQKLMSG